MFIYCVLKIKKILSISKLYIIIIGWIAIFGATKSLFLGHNNINCIQHFNDNMMFRIRSIVLFYNMVYNRLLYIYKTEIILCVGFTSITEIVGLISNYDVYLYISAFLTAEMTRFYSFK